MKNVNMAGPGGTDGCSKMNCLDKAVQTYVYAVAWPDRDVYTVTYKWCEAHDHVLSPHTYPNFELMETR